MWFHMELQVEDQVYVQSFSSFTSLFIRIKGKSKTENAGKSKSILHLTNGKYKKSHDW